MVNLYYNHHYQHKYQSHVKIFCNFSQDFMITLVKGRRMDFFFFLQYKGYLIRPICLFVTDKELNFLKMLHYILVVVG